ncbi:MAG: hypothetical protein ACLUHE_02270 [Christensenellales bacterium]
MRKSSPCRPTTKGDGRHTQVPDDVDLKTGCTIDVGSFLNALQKAADNAK